MNKLLHDKEWIFKCFVWWKIVHIKLYRIVNHINKFERKTLRQRNRFIQQGNTGISVESTLLTHYSIRWCAAKYNFDLFVSSTSTVMPENRLNILYLRPHQMVDFVAFCLKSNSILSIHVVNDLDWNVAWHHRQIRETFLLWFQLFWCRQIALETAVMSNDQWCISYQFLHTFAARSHNVTIINNLSKMK